MSDTRASFFPSGPAWLSAVLLHVFYRVYAVAMSVVVMFLIELVRKEPRLAVIGGLGVWLAPVFAVAFGHHVMHAVLDRAGGAGKVARGTLPGAGSVFAGLYSWFVMWFSTSMTVFALSRRIWFGRSARSRAAGRSRASRRRCGSSWPRSSSTPSG